MTVNPSHASSLTPILWPHTRYHLIITGLELGNTYAACFTVHLFVFLNFHDLLLKLKKERGLITLIIKNDNKVFETEQLHPNLTRLFFSILKFVPFKKINETGRFGKDEKIIKLVPFIFNFYFYYFYIFIILNLIYFIKK